MSQQSDAPGSIYDLGYRRYDGMRLGRPHAISSLFFYTLRGAFGLGRRTSSKIIPFIIVGITFIPAVVQLGVAAIASGTVDLIRPENYYGFVSVVVALFCAAIAPEIAGRDQRTRTLSLYFSRALQRSDYALAKLGAFTAAILLLTLVPQVVLFIGNALATNGTGTYIRDNWDEIPRTVASGVLIGALMASASLAIACQTRRRSYATVMVIALFLVTAPLAAIFIRETGTWGHYAILFSPFDLLNGATNAIFDVTAEPDTNMAIADLPRWIYPVVACGWIAVATGVLLRRYEGIEA